jgi:demethoxyubiquinone hydroxylase (CLK1/Coq7/Cat5 family)
MAEDISVIRPQMRHEDVQERGRTASLEARRALRKGLQTLHTLEIMAATIYKCQITSKECELNTQLTAAMCNELTHMQDFQTKLYEYGFKPSKMRWVYWLAGYIFGLGSRMLGVKRILRTGIWTEQKAVHHYGTLLDSAPWDDETRAIIAKDQADEYGHRERWQHYLDHPESICG